MSLIDFSDFFYSADPYFSFMRPWRLQPLTEASGLPSARLSQKQLLHLRLCPGYPDIVTKKFLTGLSQGFKPRSTTTGLGT